jgi:hypothetical protein
VDETNRNNIPMPQLKGAVKYEGFPSASWAVATTN